MSFGSRLKERREALHLNQAELGRILSITGAAIGNYEKGISFPKADILYRVFDALKCDANYLFQDEMNASVTPESRRLSALTNLFSQLNRDGQLKLLDSADDLVRSGKYIKTPADAAGENAV